MTLTASPASGYQFTKWEGSVTGTANPTTVTMNGNKNVTAVFSPPVQAPLIQLSPSSLTFTATSGGTAPSPKNVSITNGGGGTLSGLSRSYPDGTPLWLYSTLNGNTGPAVLTVSVSMMGPFGAFGAGTYTTRIAINASNASNSPQYINVTFTILQQPSLEAYATYDNGVCYSTLDPSFENTVYSNSMIGVGVDYFWGFYGYNYSTYASTIKFNVQDQIAGRSIEKATLRLYVYAMRGEFSFTPRIQLTALADDWNPNTLTYNIWKNMNFFIDSKIEKDAPNNSALSFEFDVTTSVRKWASGAWPNYGFNLSPILNSHSYPGNDSYQATFFQSLEFWWSSSKRPQLIVQFQ